MVGTVTALASASGSGLSSFLHGQQACGNLMARPRGRRLRMMSQAPPAGGRIDLKRGDLLDLDKLHDKTRAGVPSIYPAAGSPEYFVGNDHLEFTATLAKITYWYERDGFNPRIPPMAVTRHVRGGKTRFLQEIGMALHKKGVPVVLISFNDQTAKIERLEEDASLEQQLLWRISWAAATDEARELMDNDFKLWVERMVPSYEVVRERLERQNCVLLIDELNKLITDDLRDKQEGKDLADLLKRRFVDPLGRYLVFSSHITATGNKLVKFMHSPSDRDVIRPRLPIIKTLEDARRLGVPGGATKGSLCYLGLAPALVHDTYNIHKRNVEGCIKKRFEKLALPPLTDETVKAVVMTNVCGQEEYAEKLGEWSQALDAFDGSDAAMHGSDAVSVLYTWPPCYLAAACDKLCRPKTVNPAFRRGLVFIGKSLRELIKAPEGSGREWKGVCAAVVVMRMMQSDIARQFPSLLPSKHNNQPTNQLQPKCRRERPLTARASVRMPLWGRH
ncbi:unnamed protein product [Vitrella brassicaformis CCMP3155]|uniref:Uncharacterized protein n=2 Tax=Vitrella brassicaformis TaxID=1169539 RepID=A0A0G4F190_VITBC|nr:unnamed protein product [Vitrella brassicaformis CCMP3155]|eukprot:CEM05299.1 unnamed protein product [Vitrella brassicaformis CCMP3155]